MKKTLLCWAFTALLLSSCSLLERTPEEVEDPSAPPFDPAETAETVDTQIEPTLKGNGLESEIARLNTKVSALETKLDVLSASMERGQMQKEQPVIEAESASPQPNMAVPVDEEVQPASPHVSAAPVRPAAALPASVKHTEGASSGSEKEFQAAMELFQGGRNLEAASRFALYAKKYPRHLLAGHALYWAGEASARAQQWSLAQENWEELERSYPRSAYLPEALAGLARVHEQQGDSMKARAYRDTLVRAFPKSPVVIGLQRSGGQAQPRPAASHAPSREAEEIPNYEEEGHPSGESE